VSGGSALAVPPDTPLSEYVKTLLIYISAVLMFPAAVCSQGVLFGVQRYDYAPGDVLGSATEFLRKDAHWEGYGPGQDGEHTLVGYVLLSDDLVEVPGYSGHTLNTLVGIDPQGVITGAKIVEHAEPIVLIGLPERQIHEFVDQYVGRNIRDRIIIGNVPRDGHVVIDGISGATVTAVAENVTILEASRRIGRIAEIISQSDIRTRRPASTYEHMTWSALFRAGAIGQTTILPSDVGLAGDGPMIDLRFTLLDPPTVGRNLLGDRFFDVIKDRTKEGGSALFVVSNGSVSFKGPGFARGGIFDRIAIEQSGDLYVFKDVDYINQSEVAPEDAPNFREGGVFFLPASFDPASSFSLQLTVPYRVNDKRTYSTFPIPFQLPDRLLEEDIPFWAQRWQEAGAAAYLFPVFVILVALMFVFRQRLLPYRKWLHRSVALISVLWVGWFLKAQPSTTQILTLFNSGVRGRFPSEIFLTEPFIFVFWIIIIVSLVFWARGYFCGWMCPYGALTELLVIGRNWVIPKRISDDIDAWNPGRVLTWIKYVLFLVILGVGLVNLAAAEVLAEIEPFKTFVLRLERPTSFVAYFLLLTLGSSAFSYRSFCRFLCPLGGALALFASKPLHRLVRYDQCSSCKICHHGCEPKAISYDTGVINYRECLQCWDCQATGLDVEVCPAQIVAKRNNTVPTVISGIVLLLASLGGSVAADVHYVAPEGQSFEAVIEQCAPGDSIVIRAGIYTKKLLIEKTVSVFGEEGAVIDVGGKGDCAVIGAPNVTLKGLTLRNTGTDTEKSDTAIWLRKNAADALVEDNVVENSLFGIWVHGAPRPRLINNRITGLPDFQRNDRGDGIHLWNTKGAEIRGNTVEHSRDGIYMELSAMGVVSENTIAHSRYSVHTMWCDGTEFIDNEARSNLVGLALMFSKKIGARGNVLYDNQTHGILLVQVTRGFAIDNAIIGNTKGLFVYNSLYNEIRDNFVARNNLGLHYWGGAEDNEITGNAFVENEIQAKFVASHDQVWDGNYWSDYFGWDADGDQVGDVPYRSNTLVDGLLWRYPMARLLLASPAFQLLALAEREFPVITVPKAVDHRPQLIPADPTWFALLDQYPPRPKQYYGKMSKLPHIPGE
jgi:NosR/NirI family transcriptional regulator, nitrous oxide reductase regulator